MWYVPASLIFSSCSFLLQWSTILNLSHKTTDLTYHVFAVLSLKMISCSLLTIISVLRVVFLKLLVKPAVCNCILAHFTNWSKNHRMPEVMAMKRKSQENHKTQDSVDCCCDKYSLYSFFLTRKLFLTLTFFFFFFLFNAILHIDTVECVIYSICHELVCDQNKICSCHPLCSIVLHIQI